MDHLAVIHVEELTNTYLLHRNVMTKGLVMRLAPCTLRVAFYL